jgi:hypothetical protein
MDVETMVMPGTGLQDRQIDVITMGSMLMEKTD